MNTDFIRGVVPPVVTPVDDDERVDEPALRRVLDHVLRGGVHGILSLGSNGEFFGLDHEQQRRATAITVEHVRGRVPVFKGIGAVTTRECAQLAAMAEREGAAAITVLPPMFLTCNDNELFDHFRAIAEATPLPVLLYNNPDRIRINLSADLIARVTQIPNVVGIKDSSGDHNLTAEYLRRTRGANFKVMAGRDTLILAALVYGAAGCVASTANIVPALVVEIYEKYVAGDLRGALDAQFKLAPLRLAFNLGSFPAVTKDAMNLLGLRVGKLIRPNTSCTEANLGKLRAI